VTYEADTARTRADLVTSGPDAELEARLNAELSAYNDATVGLLDRRPFAVKAEDAGDLVGGLTGWTWGTCAGISLLWVREDARRARWGRRMLDAAERVARERGCRQIVVSSFTFQAPAFYERHGLVETGRTEGLPLEGHADVHLAKRLA
jgi:GNAT superfamily N-acetyltransferase